MFKPRFSTAVTALALLAATLPSAVLANNDNAVLNARNSVYRLWIGLPIPHQLLAAQMDEDSLQTLAQQLNSDTIAVLDTAGENVLFVHNGQIYMKFGHGTAYLVSKQGHLLTNHHVVAPDFENADENSLVGALAAAGIEPKVFVVRTTGKRLTLQSANILAAEKNPDLALVQAQSLSGEPLVLADSQYSQPTLKVFSIGFPGASDDISELGGMAHPKEFTTAVISEGSLKRPFHRHGATLLEHHAPISGGNSGGPLVNVCGQVVGTNVAVHYTQQGTAVAIDSNESKALLEQHNIPFQSSQTACEDPALAKQKQNEAAQAAQNAEQKKHLERQNQEMEAQRRRLDEQNRLIAEQNSKMINWLYGGAAAVSAVLLLIGLYLWHLRRRLTAGSAAVSQQITPVSAPPTMMNPTPTAAPAYVLTPLNAGLPETVLYENRSYALGRAPANDIILHNMQVSGQHCRLSVRADGVWVEDCQSTNGTFIDGQRISSSRLQPQQVLCLGTQEVCFTVSRL
ncbi:trypsin-like peptidase domain-containing protein [Conchiformibius steedae]|uniref:FHA domain-containing protein n=1 Tax=Conchiformibius steedae TaxID=153493 RepID=A0A3P2A1X0_9NEIS|nr:trypsin-like peptidase domain-containing protein [Conchiformibius steedae]RRD89329.1 FHA domain-containing protein [Conchiformibius steedae]